MRLKLPHTSDFKKNVLTLLTGTTIAQIIPLLISPILTRLYSPKDFGALALLTSIISIAGMVSTGVYESAIVLPKRRKDAINVMALCHLIVFSFCILLYPVLWLSHGTIANWITDDKVMHWLYLVPVAAALMGLNQSYTNWSIRESRYKRLATNKVSQNITVAAANLTGGFIGMGVSGLIIGFISGHFVSVMQLFYRIMKRDGIRLQDIQWPRIKLNAIKYQDFPKINLPQVLIDTLQASLIVFAIKGIWGVAILGLYAFMMRILKAPLNVIGGSIAQVFFQRASQVYNNQESLYILLKKALRSLALIGILPFALLLFFAPALFAFAFGEAWREAGVYAQLQVPWLFFNFIYSPVSQIPLILNKQKQAFIVGLFYNLIIFGVIYYMGMRGYSPHTTFLTLSVAISGYFLLMFLWLLKITRNTHTLQDQNRLKLK